MGDNGGDVMQKLLSWVENKLTTHAQLHKWLYDTTLSLDKVIKRG